MNVRHWPTVLALLAVAVLGSYLVYTERLVRDIRHEAEIHKHMYAIVQDGLMALEPDAPLEALVELQRTFQELGIPVVVVNADGEPAASANLPFDADPANPKDRQRLLDYAARLDLRNPPVVNEELGTIHFGPPPMEGRLRWVAWLQLAGAGLLLFIGYVIVRGTVGAERERVWSSMARELAHQMGTPLTSLRGWVEMLQLPPERRAELAPDARIAHEVGADLERLERVSRRFELIGKPPELVPVSVGAVVRELERYLRPRLPRFTPGVELVVRLRSGLPSVLANRVLLVWALENLVKNALDALAGRGGRIRVLAMRGEKGIRFVVADDGPGIDSTVRDQLFEAGATTKEGGWGVGLSLTRRIVENVHRGRINYRPGTPHGTVFDIDIPAAEEAASKTPGQ
jgi:signal transduction histidine kinase